MSTALKAGKISVAVFGSRLLGLVRESVFAHFFGAGMASDAFRAAFKIPNLLRDLFAEGALSTAFVATFTKTLEQEGDKKGWRLANLVFTAQFVFLFLIVLIGIACAPAIVELIGGPLPSDTKHLATSLTRIMFPFIMLVSAAAVMMGLLNAKGRFGLPASASIFFNLGSIVAGVGLAYAIDPMFGPRSILGMALGVLIGGALQFGVQVPAAWRMGFRFHWLWDFRDNRFLEVMRLLGPAVIGASAVQINVLVNTRFAAEVGEGAISWLEYAFRLMQFPIGLLGVAIATVTLPQVARNAASNDQSSFRKNLAKSLRLTFALTIPAAVGLAIVAESLITLLYQRGKFHFHDTQQTALALQAYTIGLAGYAAIKVIVPAFYALGDAKVPVRVSGFGIFLNLGLNFLTVKILHWGHAGLALATSSVALLNFLQLAYAMRTRLKRLEGKLLATTLLKTIAASLGMGTIVWATQKFFYDWGSFIRVAGGVGFGVISFIFFAKLLHIEEIEEIYSGLKQRWKK
ncbi:MAG: murein biosynthesis integral membrane protein MurJ [Verrucomicrobiae bacterium]|nr:murein biosynthesis integral membrane protein MurJ [Verrucomicrobiae bacterium]